MKLQNKRTGEIVELVGIVCLNGRTFFRFDDGKGIFKIEANSLSEINKEWKDFEPTEPLIKDEKIRKVVRAWADVVGTNKCTYDRFWETLRSMDTSISFAGVYQF